MYSNISLACSLQLTRARARGVVVGGGLAEVGDGESWGDGGGGAARIEIDR